MARQQHSQAPDPGAAHQDLVTDEVNHDALSNLVMTAMDKAIAAAVTRHYADINIPQLLRSMRETHGSMRAIYTAAEKIEANREEPTGRWVDMLVLARAQLDAVFVGLLLAHDGNRWGPCYYKACWATEAQRHVYVMRRFRDTAAGRRIRNTNMFKLKRRARDCKVTKREWVATLAEIRDKPLRFGAENGDRIRPLPTPGKIVGDGILADGAYADLAQVLWQDWKFLCDPSHAGLSCITLRNAFREEQFGKLGEKIRADMIRQEVVDRSVLPSFVAIITLITVLATGHKDNVDLMATVSNAWDLLAKGTVEGGIVWDKWAREALGVLPHG